MIALSCILIILVPLVHHLGFFDKAYKVIGLVIKCSMCCTFWISLIVFLIYEKPLLPAIAVSFILAYLSSYVNLLLILLDKAYTWIWKKIM